MIEIDKVLAFVDRTSRRNDNMGCYGQCSKLADTRNIQYIILRLQGGTIIAAALTYCTRSPVARDLPWASTITDDVGGVAYDVPHGSVMIRLLDTWISIPENQETNKMIIDAVKGGDDGYLELGFQNWARYMEVWSECPNGGIGAK
ncbi:hypothetical protein C7999DRAFT_36202 [Corynascus novoguineensis]|uniref:Uncharacterized protein n=1 Tax=Corynascus novoguineensis TaxID=1126955 RepID=A0AAN7CJV5_9PEZI|nr:hypothetical protein C7999DRAFT_36202 [Corynascus novoguineensis]